jgi:hypothetical protein
MSPSTLGFAVWGILAFLAAFWPMFYFFGRTWLSATELKRIAPRFEGIFWQWLGIGIAFAILVILPTAFLGVYLDVWFSAKCGARFYPEMAFMFSPIGIVQGWFAVIKGVYPMKSMDFIYEDEQGDHLRRIGKYQIAGCLVVLAASLVYLGATLATCRQ